MCWYTLLRLGFCLLSETIGPRIVSGPENQTVVIEVDTNGLVFFPLNVTFSCLASGSTRPTVTWSSNAVYSDFVVVETLLDDHEISSNLTLVGIEPSIAENGVVCRAENEAGVVEASAGLTTLRKYSVPTSVPTDL